MCSVIYTQQAPEETPCIVSLPHFEDAMKLEISIFAERL